MANMVTRVKNQLGVSLTMTGKEFIELNKKVLEKNNNLKEQIGFLKENDCYEKKEHLKCMEEQSEF